MDKKTRIYRRHICGSHRLFLFIFSLARIQSQFSRKAKGYCFTEWPGKGNGLANTQPVFDRGKEFKIHFFIQAMLYMMIRVPSQSTQNATKEQC